MTAGDIIAAALRELGVVAASEVPTAQELADGLVSLNNLVDQWATERLQVYTVTRTTWTIVSGTASYTVGLGGTVNVARPVWVDHINFIDTTPNPDLEYQTNLLTDDAYSKIPQKALTSPFPQNWYYNPTFPLGTLIPWPVPTSSTLQGVLYAPAAVAEFATTGTAISLPPGYRRMITKNLALDLAPAYGREIHPALIQGATESKAAVKRSNFHLMDMSIESAALIQARGGRFYYNINTGP